MTPRAKRTVTCSPVERAGRQARAEEFWQSAEDLRELDDGSNAVLSLYVLAGIAASDVVCCARLGEYSKSENHADAIGLLRRADPSLVPPLQRLLSRKSESAYGVAPMSATRVTEARSAADKLVRAARRL
ncbi:hypothetical protein [Microbacterium thalassium]|uniref:HEPN domain-containing protein n=1 Tax=Microbacterium thalassium TaxID=362649 RepID=A0A7X0KUF2_9MICO|nr:hypothetical protein [Microbacterium thalassium]MBB6391097.1 hypothetical protein [Microbacterium thalassium]GLK23793.1 hypothetical protein GCM10017607_11110 [Microbacterium thalassium]